MKHRAWKLMLCLALVMSFAIGSTGALAARVPTVMILKVTADGARVRTGSENGNEIITSLRKNTKVFYMGANDGAFCLIRTVDGIFGYVYRGFLEGYGRPARIRRTWRSWWKTNACWCSWCAAAGRLSSA